MLEVKDMALYGRLLGAEQDGVWRGRGIKILTVFEIGTCSLKTSAVA